MYSVLFMPLVCAVGCFLCLSLLIFFLFRPESPIRIGSLQIIGLVPGHIEVWSNKLGNLIYDKIIEQKSAIESEISSEERIVQLLPFIEGHIDEFLRVKLPVSMPMIGMLIGDKTIQQIKEVFVAEIKTLFPKILLEYLQNLTTDGKLKSVIQKQLQVSSANAYVQELRANCKPLIFKIKIFSLVFGLIFGALVNLF